MIVWCTNDAAVMLAWAKENKIGFRNLLQLMGEPTGDLAKALDMELTHPGPTLEKGLLNRCKRHALYVVDGEIKAIHISEKPDDPAGDADPSKTLAESMLEAIKSV